MFQSVKGYRKEDLLFVAAEIGETLPERITILELKDIISKNKGYLEDPEFVTSILETAVSERKERDKQIELEKLRLEHELELGRIQTMAPNTEEFPNTVTVSARRKLEFRQFNGDIKEWLPFWSQFQHIHNDSDIPPENKFQYLVQATVSGSRAREVVESFPPTAANYAKAVESLKARFGKDDLLVEVYVRELIKLIISVQRHEKISLTSLYDKLETYLRALETLGVTTDKCASILYPMVESCFQEDFLKAWNRSAFSTASTDAKGRLTNLMAFLKGETEGEERINLEMAGFGLGTNEKYQSFKKRGRELATKRVPTAANLLTTTSKDVKHLCVFCSKTHPSSDCFTARKMSLAERQSILRERHGCFASFLPGLLYGSAKPFF